MKARTCGRIATELADGLHRRLFRPWTALVVKRAIKTRKTASAALSAKGISSVS
jgi:hypothetical protein